MAARRQFATARSRSHDGVSPGSSPVAPAPTQAIHATRDAYVEAGSVRSVPAVLRVGRYRGTAAQPERDVRWEVGAKALDEAAPGAPNRAPATFYENAWRTVPLLARPCTRWPEL